MKDFLVKMSNGATYFIRGEKMDDILVQIGQSRLLYRGFLDVRVPVTYKYVTINVEQIVAIEEEDDF